MFLDLGSISFDWDAGFDPATLLWLNIARSDIPDWAQIEMLKGPFKDLFSLFNLKEEEEWNPNTRFFQNTSLYSTGAFAQRHFYDNYRLGVEK